MTQKLTALLVLLGVLAGCSAPAAVPTTTPPTPVNTPRSETLAPTAPAATATLAPTPLPPSVTASTPSVPTPAATGPITITLLHTNDMHGTFEGEKLKGGNDVPFEFGGIVNAVGTIARLKQEVGPNTITLDAGDFWQGTFASNRDEGRAIIAAMNSVGYDALTLGNHDFDHGQDVLKARAAEAKFSFLAANLYEEATGKPPAWVKPYLIKQVAGLRFGIIGLANSGTPVISKASNSKGLRFVQESEAVKQILPEVQRQADFIIVLAHQGLDKDQLLATQVPGISVIVSSHTHVEQRVSKSVDGVVIVHAGYKAQNVGRLQLQIDPSTKKILDYTRTGELVPAVSTRATPPKDIAELFSKLLADARDEMNRPIGETLTDLRRQFTADGRTTAEYPLGNLVVDAMLAANQAGSRPAELAMYNQGIRADLLQGTITYGKLYEVLPFDNQMAALELTGADIKAILEIATSCPRVNTLVAGMSFVYDCSKDSGQRVSNIRIQGAPIDLTKKYRVQTIDYLIGGGDGQTPFTRGTDVAYGDAVVDVVAEYVRTHSPLNLQVEGRITPAAP